MKKLVMFLLCLSLSLSVAHAGDDYDSHFVTQDGQHMCGKFQDDTFYPCEEVGITYNANDTVIQGKEPFFTYGSIWKELAFVGKKTFCVDDGRAITDLSECNRTYQVGDGFGIIECTALEGVKNCILKEGTADTPFGETVMKNSKKDTVNTSFGESVMKNSTCTVNGEPIDCAEVTQGIKNAFQIGIWIFLVGGILFLIGFVFWIYTIIHALSNPVPNKVLWVLVLIFLGIIGSIIYYFVIMRKYKAVLVPNPQNPPYQMNVGVTYHEGPVTEYTHEQNQSSGVTAGGTRNE